MTLLHVQRVAENELYNSPIWIKDAEIDFMKMSKNESPLYLYHEAKAFLRVQHYQRVSLSELNSSLEKLKLCHDLLLNNDNNLNKILEKSSKRPRHDSKVAPGSNNVQRSLTDNRYLLSQSCLYISLVYERFNDYEQIIKYLYESLLWFPKNIESIQRLAAIERSLATDNTTLTRIENNLKRALIITNELRNNTINMNTNILTSELLHGKIAAENLAMLLCQRCEYSEADDILRQLGYTWRLSSNILSYTLDTRTTTASKNVAIPCPLAYSIENTVDTSSLQYLQGLFRPGAPFWSEHDYDHIGTNSSRKVGYFSYLYPYKERSAVCHLECIIDRLREVVIRHFPVVAEANYGMTLIA